MRPFQPEVPVPSPGSPPAGRLAAARDDAVPVRPGWTEIVLGVGVFLVLEFGGIPLIKQIGLDPAVFGLVLGAWSGIAGVAGAAAARAPRVRSWATFGVRTTTWGWLAAGVGAGVAAWLLGRVVIIGYVALTGDTTDVQQVYTQTSTAGVAYLVVNLVLLAVLTPIGEELLFRGVVTTALLRYGPATAVVGSAVIFAAVHGPNAVAVVALVVGLINAELRRRSGSIWPGVVMHVVNNLMANAFAVLIAAVG